MLLWLLNRLDFLWPGGHVALEKITFRASLAAGIAFALAVLLGPRWIGWLRSRFREPIKCDSAEIRQLHRDKESTPTMGGLFIVAGLLAAAMTFGDLGNPYLQLALLLTGGLTLIGTVDDLVKLRGRANGISARSKLAAQFVVAAVVAVLLYRCHATTPDGLSLRLPLIGTSLSLGLWFIPLAILVIVGASNAVNLTDGLDGLAGGCLIFATVAMTAVAYASGHAELAAYLGIPRIPGSGEMTVVAGGMIGGVLGFLWFNCHPAQVFMGDTGALPLGGLLGLLAVVARQELLLAIVGGVFVVEAASVVLQVGCRTLRRPKIFLCAPLHHHFQLRGWAENKIVVRFWIASALCALLGVATLKVSVRGDGPAGVSRPAAAASTTPARHLAAEVQAKR